MKNYKAPNPFQKKTKLSEKQKNFLDKHFVERSPEEEKKKLEEHEKWVKENLFNTTEETLEQEINDSDNNAFFTDTFLKNVGKAFAEAKKRFENNNNSISEEELKKEFLNLLEIARENINMDAMYVVAHSYFNGNGVRANYVEAIYWITKSELLGHPDAPILRKQIERKASDLQIASAIQRLKEETPK